MLTHAPGPLLCTQALLAISTGAGAGFAGTYVVAREVWQRAQQQGEAAEGFCGSLREQRGVFAAPQPTSPEPFDVPSLYELRLQRVMSNKWNEAVHSVHDTVKRWL